MTCRLSYPTRSVVAFFHTEDSGEKLSLLAIQNRHDYPKQVQGRQ